MLICKTEVSILLQGTLEQIKQWEIRRPRFPSCFASPKLNKPCPLGALISSLDQLCPLWALKCKGQGLREATLLSILFCTRQQSQLCGVWRPSQGSVMPSSFTQERAKGQMRGYWFSSEIGEAREEGLGVNVIQTFSFSKVLLWESISAPPSPAAVEFGAC